MAVSVLLDRCVEPLRDPVAVLDDNSLDAVESDPRHERVGALQPFGVFPVVLQNLPVSLLADSASSTVASRSPLRTWAPAAPPM